MEGNFRRCQWNGLVDEEVALFSGGDKIIIYYPMTDSDGDGRYSDFNFGAKWMPIQIKSEHPENVYRTECKVKFLYNDGPQLDSVAQMDPLNGKSTTGNLRIGQIFKANHRSSDIFSNQLFTEPVQPHDI